MGNFIVAGKRLSDLSREQVLITRSTYERAMSEIKAEKIKVNGAEVYEIKRIVDKEKSKKFIGEFLERQEKFKRK